MVTVDKTFVRVCSSSELPQKGASIRIEVGKQLDEAIALYRLPDGRLVALADKCAHGRGQLSLGDIEDAGSCAEGRHADGSTVAGMCIVCPKHRGKFPKGLLFSVEDGHGFCREETPHFTSHFKVNVYDVVEEEGEVYVRRRNQKKIDKSVKAKIRREKIKIGFQKVFRLGRFSKKNREKDEEEQGGEECGSAVNFYSCTVVSNEKHHEGSDSIIITLKYDDVEGACPRPNHSSGPIWHITVREHLKAREKGVVKDKSSPLVDRDYTPVSSIEEYEQGILRLLVKVYKQGVMSRYLQSLKKGEKVDCSDDQVTLELPLGKVGGQESAENAEKEEKMKKKESSFCAVLMIVGGTGIAPALQLLTHAVSPRDQPSVVTGGEGKVCRMVLIYSSRSSKDLLMEDELIELRKQAGKQLSLYLHITGPNEDGSLKNLKPETVSAVKEVAFERVDSTRLAQLAEEHSMSNTFAVISGPESMNVAMKKALSEVGFESDRIRELEA